MITPPDLGLPGKFAAFRPGQFEVSAKVSASDKYAFMLDAPTGVGKSLIAATIQKLKKKGVLYVCTTKQLQDQLLADFPYARTLKGRNNYPCLKYLKMFPRVSAEECTHSEAHPCDSKPNCPYMVAKAAALSAPIAVLNTAYFLTEANYVGTFSGYEYVVIDEFDTTEDVLMSFIEVLITQKQLDNLGLDPPKYKTKFESWVEWSREAVNLLEPRLYSIRNSLEGSWATIDFELMREEKNLSRLVAKLKFFIKEVDKNWVWYPSEDRWSFKPVWISRYANSALWKHAQKVLGMSATILDPAQIGRNVGIESKAIGYRALGSPFPKENRPVYYDPVANVTNKEMASALPALTKKIAQVLEKHKDDKVLCFPSGTLVTTSKGYKPIESIGVGDLVFTHKGRYRKVTAVHSRAYDGDLYRVDPVGSLEFSCTPDHPIGVLSMHDDICWEESRNLRTSMLLFTPPFVDEALSLPNMRIKLGARSAHSELITSSPGFWYIVGEWLAEGFFGSSNQIRWSVPHAWQSIKIINSAQEAHLHAWYNKSTQCVLATCKDLASWLEGNFSRGARNKVVPAWVLSLPRALRQALYDGYNDGDGCRTQPGSIEKWGSVSDSLALGVRDVSRSLGFLPISYRTSQGIYCSVNAGPPRPYPRGMNFTSIREVSKEYYHGIVHNISVDEDESYVLDLVAVHNCHTVSYKVRNYLKDHLSSPRIITHDISNRAEVLDGFKASPRPLVLLSPSMDRGVDLPGDECRAVIIAKVPYPDLGDPQISRRVYASTDGNRWYAHKTVSKIIQMAGRGVRNEEDYAATYILDRQFGRVYSENKRIFPAWFKEALVL